MPRLRVVAAPQVTGEDAAVGDARLERGHGLLVRDLLALEVALHQLVGDLGHLVHQLLAVLLGALLELLGDLGLLRAAAVVALVDERLHVDQVDHAAQLVLGADRDLGGHHVLPEGVLQRVERAEEVGALAVEHVHEEHARQPELLGALPEPVGGDLHAHHAVDHEHGAVRRAQRRQRVGHEARVAGGVDQVDLAVLPAKRGEARLDRHLARLLVGRRVRHRRAVRHRAQPVDRARLEEERLVQGGLPAAPVAQQGHVADPLRLVVHGAVSSPRWRGHDTPPD